MPAILYILFAMLFLLGSSYLLRLRRLIRRSSNPSPRIIGRHSPRGLHFLRG